VRFPVTPGHEIAGRIDALGEGVQGWREGERVAIGWSGGYCGHCRSCRRGEFVHCEVGMVTGASFPGGYADYVAARLRARWPVFPTNYRQLTPRHSPAPG
jgi:alcohol dehydrogenase